MSSRAETYQYFAERFHGGKKIRPSTELQIAAAETKLGVLWPESYRQFALTCGAVWSPSVLTLITERKLPFADVQDFLTPQQSVTWSRRLPLEPVGAWLAFANDCGGNYFVFRDLPASPPRPDDAVVWIYDHEYDEVNQEAESFDEWIGRFLAL